MDMSISKHCIAIFFLFLWGPASHGQSHDAQVLVLNYAKWETIKKTVSEVQESIEILGKWYGRIEDVANGDLKVHSVFLDELKEVSPTVSNYYKVADIIKKQKVIIGHYERFFQFVNASENFNEREIEYLENMFSNLLWESGDHLEQLFMVVTASDMNMGDYERIAVIDALSEKMDAQLGFLKGLNQRIYIISAYKDREKGDIRELEGYNGLNID